MDIAQTTTVLGWCTVINGVLLLAMALALATMRDFITSIHAPMFGLATQELNAMYFNYMANYKLLIIIFNLVPYCALRLMP